MPGETVDTASKVRGLLEAVLAHMGYDLVYVELVRQGPWILRLYIDSATGITLKDCTEVTHRVSDILDVEDPIDVPYTLEVSSPGLDRPLDRLKDFARFAGKRARIKTRDKIQGRRNFIGVLDGVGDSEVRINVDGQPFTIPHAAIQKANLEVEL